MPRTPSTSSWPLKSRTSRSVTLAAEMIVAVGVAAGAAERAFAGDFERERRACIRRGSGPTRVKDPLHLLTIHDRPPLGSRRHETTHACSQMGWRRRQRRVRPLSACARFACCRAAARAHRAECGAPTLARHRCRPCCRRRSARRAFARPPTNLSRGRAATAKASRCRTATATRGCRNRARRRCRATSRSSRRSAAEARAKGARWSALDLDTRRALLDAAFTKAGVRGLPPRPTGQHVVADLMAFYFRSSEANDASLQRDDQPRGVPADRDHDAEAGAAR